MSDKVIAELEFSPEEISGAVEMLLSALVASNGKVIVQGGWRRKVIGFNEWNRVSGEEIPPAVKPIVLANDDPIIGIAFVRHRKPPRRLRYLHPDFESLPQRQGTGSFLPSYSAAITIGPAGEKSKLRADQTRHL